MSGGAADEFGTLERRGDVSVLRYERHLAHPRERVWRAITEDADLAAWFPTTIEGPRRAGAPLRFSFRQGEAEAFDGEMLAFVPPTLMELRWADDVLRFELERRGRAASTRCGLHPAALGDVHRVRQGGPRRRRLARLPGAAVRIVRRRRRRACVRAGPLEELSTDLRGALRARGVGHRSALEAP